MKRCNVQDLQRIYGDVPRELTDQVRQKLSDLSEFRPTDGRKMSRLRAVIEEEKNMRKKFSFRMTGVVAVLISLTAIAFAASEINKWLRINWKADTIVNTPVDSTDYDPVGPEAITALREMLDKMYTLMKEAPENAYVTIESESNSRIARQRVRTIHSFSDLPRANFTIPAILPEDGSIRMNLELGCIPEGEYKLINQKTADEYTLKQYDVDSAYDVIIGYEISYLNGETVERTIHSHLVASDQNEFGFRAEDSSTAEPVSIPGMDKAVFISSKQYPRLIMIRKLNIPVHVKTAPLDYIPDAKNATTEYRYELITVNGFSFEEATDLFSALQ